MNEDDYEAIANTAIGEAERESRSDSIESFYRGLRTIIQTVQERMECASADGVDLNEL